MAEKVVPTTAHLAWAMGIVDEFNKLTSRPVPNRGPHSAILADRLCRREAEIISIERSRCAQICIDNGAADAAVLILKEETPVGEV